MHVISNNIKEFWLYRNGCYSQTAWQLSLYCAIYVIFAINLAMSCKVKYEPDQGQKSLRISKENLENFLFSDEQQRQ